MDCFSVNQKLIYKCYAPNFGSLINPLKHPSLRTICQEMIQLGQYLILFIFRVTILFQRAVLSFCRWKEDITWLTGGGGWFLYNSWAENFLPLLQPWIFWGHKSLVRSPGMAAFPAWCRMGTFNSLSCSHPTREVTQARGVAGSQFMPPPGYIFHLNCAYSAVGMHWYLADSWKSAQAHGKTQPKAFWDEGLMGGGRQEETFHLTFWYSLLCVQNTSSDACRHHSDQSW